MGSSGWSGLGDVAEMTGRDLQCHRQGLLGLVPESAVDVDRVLGPFLTSLVLCEGLLGGFEPSQVPVKARA